MPQIIVAADRGAAFGDGAVTFRETVNVADFESQHFATQLVERLGWAVEDADQVERVSPPPERSASGRESRRIASNGRVRHAVEASDAQDAEDVDAAGPEVDAADPDVDADGTPEPEPRERVIVRSPA